MTDPNLVTLPFLHKEEIQETFDLGSVFITEETEEGEKIDTIEDVCREYTLQRILSSFDINSRVRSAFQHPLPDEIPSDSEKEYVLSYMVSRMALSELNNPFLSYLFTVQEARKSMYHLKESPVVDKIETIDQLNLSNTLSGIP
jgi:hypothetical protein